MQHVDQIGGMGRHRRETGQRHRKERDVPIAGAPTTTPAATTGRRSWLHISGTLRAHPENTRRRRGSCGGMPVRCRTDMAWLGKNQAGGDSGEEARIRGSMWSRGHAASANASWDGPERAVRRICLAWRIPVGSVDPLHPSDNHGDGAGPACHGSLCSFWTGSCG
ncbi:protein of unknown function [Rhodovastum atsumiense]|nr:protein of unknown function [Rhodovastum atsumiense]